MTYYNSCLTKALLNVPIKNMVAVKSMRLNKNWLAPILTCKMSLIIKSVIISYAVMYVLAVNYYTATVWYGI